METIGVLIMAYGGPNNMDEVRPYLLDVRGGRPTSEEIFHEVEERYRQIGGRSPILERTQAQADAIQAALREKAGDGQVEFKAYVGMRHWTPYIRQALAQVEVHAHAVVDDAHQVLHAKRQACRTMVFGNRNIDDHIGIKYVAEDIRLFQFRREAPLLQEDLNNRI